MAMSDWERDLFFEKFRDALYAEPLFIRTKSELRIQTLSNPLISYIEQRSRLWSDAGERGYGHPFYERTGYEYEPLYSFSIFMAGYQHDMLALRSAINVSLELGDAWLLSDYYIAPPKVELVVKEISDSVNYEEDYSFEYMAPQTDKYSFRPMDVDKQLPAAICRLTVMRNTPQLRLRLPKIYYTTAKRPTLEDVLDVMDELSPEAQEIMAMYLPFFANDNS